MSANLAVRSDLWAFVRLLQREGRRPRRIADYERRVSHMEHAIEEIEARAMVLGAHYGINPDTLLRSLHAAFTWALLLPREDPSRRKRIHAARERAVDMVIATICVRRPKYTDTDPGASALKSPAVRPSEAPTPT